MKIARIEKLGEQEVYDISVKDAEHYVLENGVVTHNTGIQYSSDNIFIMGRAQEKDGTELSGYNFTINIDKSRYVREKSKFPLLVTFEHGIQKYSGLLDIAIELEFVTKPKVGWYTRQIPNTKTGEVAEDKLWRAKDTMCAEFWDPLLKCEAFSDAISNRYKLGGMVSRNQADEDVDVDDVSLEIPDEE